MEWEITEFTGINNVPMSFTLVPLFNRNNTVDDVDFISSLIYTLKLNIKNMVKNYNPFMANSFIDKVAGHVLFSNIIEYSEFFQTEMLRYDELDDSGLLDNFETITQSNKKITIYDIKIEFLFDPQSLVFGRGVVDSLKIPLWVKSAKDTWQNHEYRGRKINCAAYAIGKFLNTKYPIKKAIKIMDELGWGEYVNHEDLQSYVELYTDMKIVLLVGRNVYKGDVFVGPDYVYNKDKIIYLYLHSYTLNDEINFHYALLFSPLRQITHSRQYRWCNYCDYAYNYKAGHECEEAGCIYKKHEYDDCLECGVKKYPGHRCDFIKCRWCNKGYGKNKKHLCPLPVKEDFDMSKLKDERVIIWDSECLFKEYATCKQMIKSIETDGQGRYLSEKPSLITTYHYKIEKHTPIYIAALDIFGDIETGEDKMFKFFGTDCVRRFVNFFMQYNDGKNILLAHNSSGYDSRLIYDEISKYYKNEAINIIRRGSKIVRLQVNKLVFLDTLLHLPGSLSSLGKAFGCSTVKGFFPFKFKPDTFDYEGNIPGLDKFGIEYIKNDDAYNDLIKWHSGWEGVWNYKNEMMKYCDNDVRMLCTIAKSYMYGWLSKGIHPWKKSTGPGVVHQFIKKYQYNLAILYDPPPPIEDEDAYYAWNDRFCRNSWFCVQTDYEHNFARQALRGGRTQNHILYSSAPEGYEYKYLDVVSLYPSVQINEEDLPIGVPTKHVYDYRFLPCTCKKMKTGTMCSCTVKYKEHDWKYQEMINTGELVIHDTQPTDYKNMFGVMCVDLLPPNNLIHPVLILYDEERKKCISTLDPEKHKMIYINSPSFHKCLEMGYKVLKFYSFHEYKKKNLFKHATLELFLEKLKYSFDPPPLEERHAILERYSGYGDEFCKKLEASFDSWEKNGAKRFIAKIALNSGWGKHAQRNRMSSDYIFNPQKSDDIEKFKSIMADVARGVKQIKSYIHLGGKDMLSTINVGGKSDIHDQYLAAASFVPEYGRLILYEKMLEYGKDTCYNDTDSIIALVKSSEVYKIKLGDMPGDWSDEYPDKVIKELASPAAKCYSICFSDGSTFTKCKGVTVGRAVDNIVNHKSYKKICKSMMETGIVEPLMVPQNKFVYNFDYIRNDISWKAIGLKKSDMKGKLIDGYIYPFGYDESLIK